MSLPPTRLAVLVLAAVALGAPAAAASGPPHDVARTNISNIEPAWSPDGRFVAFARESSNGPGVYVVDVKERRVRLISTGASSPAWIGRGGLLTFQAGLGPTVVDLSGHQIRQLRGLDRARWSPDDRSVVFDRQGPRNLRHWIIVADAEGRHRRVLERNGNYDGAEPVWSPDSKEIAYVGGNNTDFATIEIVGRDGSHYRDVTHAGHEYFPAWSPDGKLIAYTSEGGLHDSYNHIGVVGADGRAEHLLTHGRWNDSLPTWSPDGRWIAFDSDRTGNDEIWVMRPDGSDQHRLTYGGCSIIGTSGSDRLVGTRGRDVICGLGGDDTIYGRGGDDRILGGPGADRIFGGPGDDTIFGQAGDDVIVGGPGRDTIDAGGGDDTVVANDGTHDRIEGGPGHDRALGDRADFAYDVELGNLRDHLHPREPSRAAIIARTIGAVRRSRAALVSLVVRVPRDRYFLTVRVADPAVYLLHRANRVVTVMNRVTVSRRVRFRRILFAVEDAHGGTVFSWSYSRGGGVTSFGAHVAPQYRGCTGSIDLEQGEELGTLPPCPAR